MIYLPHPSSNANLIITVQYKKMSKMKILAKNIPSYIINYIYIYNLYKFT